MKKRTNNEFKQEVFNLVQSEYSVLGEYETCHTKILIKHNKCGHKYKIRPKEFLRGNRCPYCKRSTGEEFIENYLKENNIPYEREVSFPDCKYKRLLKFDFKIYNEDKTNYILLEYNGIQHYKKAIFQYDEDFKIGLKRDQIKQKYCLNNQIHLEIIRYDENIEERLKEIISKLKD